MKLQRRSRADGYEASHTAVAELKAEGVLPESVEVRTSRYLNNLTRAGPPKSEAAVLPDARLQAVQERGRHHQRDLG